MLAYNPRHWKVIESPLTKRAVTQSFLHNAFLRNTPSDCAALSCALSVVKCGQQWACFAVAFVTSLVCLAR